MASQHKWKYEKYKSVFLFNFEVKGGVFYIPFFMPKNVSVAYMLSKSVAYTLNHTAKPYFARVSALL